MKPADRDLGYVRVAANEYRFTEPALLTAESMAEDQQFAASLPNVEMKYMGALVVSEWRARLNDRIVGLGILMKIDHDMCAAWVVVHPDHRNVGVGKFMCRLITDLAIRHRQRVIIAELPDDDGRVKHILEGEEFDERPGGGSMRKELKWS
jgi:GNAT superfamily N-acetyltransferase